MASRVLSKSPIAKYTHHHTHTTMYTHRENTGTIKIKETYIYPLKTVMMKSKEAGTEEAEADKTGLHNDCWATYGHIMTACRKTNKNQRDIRTDGAASSLPLACLRHGVDAHLPVSYLSPLSPQANIKDLRGICSKVF